MPKPYNPIVNDEVLYWFDVLENNSIDNISNITDIHRDKVRKILEEKYSEKKVYHANH